MVNSPTERPPAGRGPRPVNSHTGQAHGESSPHPAIPPRRMRPQLEAPSPRCPAERRPEKADTAQVSSFSAGGICAAVNYSRGLSDFPCTTWPPWGVTALLQALSDRTVPVRTGWEENGFLPGCPCGKGSELQRPENERE